jgi:electron transfer flavoprotein alpha subunit
MSVLILAEHDNKRVKAVSRHALTAALALSPEVDILVVGYHCEAVVKEVASWPAIRTVFFADAESYAHQLAENTAQLLAEKAKNYAYLLATASTFSKNILPRASALLNVNMISEVIAILSPDTFVRPLYAGNVLATVQSPDPIKVLTIRGTAFPAASLGTRERAANMERCESVFPNESSQFIQQNLTQSERPELTSARIVLSGGRGLKSADNFKLLEALADRLGAAIGASRAAVDAGYAPNDYQVGQTGKVVAPDLYIAIGISGAIQHVAGMKDSKVIVAINSDPDAPIFQVADYALVGDLFQILPALQAELDKN